MDKEVVRISPQDEMQILALLARGDLTQQQIADKFNTTQVTISKVGLRNPDTLAILKENLQKHRISQASSILEKANTQIAQRLDESDQYENKLGELRQEYENGEIDEVVFKARLNKLQRLNITELTSVSREMHSQTKTEGPSTGPALNPAETKEYLVNLAKGLDTGDEVVLQQLIFRKPQ